MKMKRLATVGDDDGDTEQGQTERRKAWTSFWASVSYEIYANADYNDLYWLNAFMISRVLVAFGLWTQVHMWQNLLT